MIKKLALLLAPESEMGGDQTTGDDARAHAEESTEGKSMAEYIREKTGFGKGEDLSNEKKEEESDGNAQQLGDTEEENADGGDDKDEETQDEEGKKKSADEEAEKGDEDAEAEDEQAKKDETDDAEKKDEQEQGPVPYERFEEVNTKYRTLEAEVAELKPYAEHHRKISDFCAQNNITDEQFRQNLEITALLNTNPEEALKRLLPIVEAVQGFTGDRLPSDLQKKVDNGTLELADAREMASLRAKAQFGTNRYDQYQKKIEEQRMMETQRQMENAMNTWTQARLKTNPDFKPKAKKEDVDGIYEFTVDRYINLVSQRDAQGRFVNPCMHPKQVTDLLERAYNEVSKAFRPSAKPKTKPNLSSHLGGKTNGRAVRPEDAKSMQEVVRNAAAGRY